MSSAPTLSRESTAQGTVGHSEESGMTWADQVEQEQVHMGPQPPARPVVVEHVAGVTHPVVVEHVAGVALVGPPPAVEQRPPSSSDEHSGTCSGGSNGLSSDHGARRRGGRQRRQHAQPRGGYAPPAPGALPVPQPNVLPQVPCFAPNQQPVPPPPPQDPMYPNGAVPPPQPMYGGAAYDQQAYNVGATMYSSPPPPAAPLPPRAPEAGARPRRGGGGGKRGSSSDSGAGAWKGSVPWAPRGARGAPQPSTLAEEMSLFASFASLNPQERQQREDALQTVRVVAEGIWAASDTLPYGSFALGLSLTGSDVDAAVDSCGHGLAHEMDTFAAAMLEQRFQILGSMSNPGDAFMKLRAPSGVIVNLSLTAGRSPVREGLSLLRSELGQYPQAAPTVLVLRTVLAQCQLTDVASGGLSSYSVLLLILRLCQRHGPGGLCPDAGVLLKQFLHHYSVEFDYAKETAALATPAHPVTPVERLHPQSIVSIADPLDPNNNVAQGFTKLPTMRSMLRYCALALARWDEPVPAGTQRLGSSFRGRTPLSTIIASKGAAERRKA